MGGASPWDGFEYAGAIVGDEWAIDGTVLKTDDFGNFFVFSCFHGLPNQSLCIQPLGEDYISVTGEVSILSEPTEPWELINTPVNEGAYALYLNGVTYLSFSASFCWSPSYCLGLLTWDGTNDPADRAAWSKSDGCEMSSANGHFSTGHNSFLQVGDATWTVYHAAANPNGACDGTRYTMMQPLEVNDDGTPRFQQPAPFSEEFPEPSL
ncbi:family 43 glycosylhydrolase [Candidatus Bathyarchaeota archaeon]|nr:family 43 glycosylhydrolase [Candidatus Bathyarchaeota archaeon]